MSAQRLLIRNGFVVSMDPGLGDIPNGDVFVEDGKIVEVGRGLSISDVEEIDASGMIVMPGFVDTHRHTWQTPVRGVLPCCTLDHYFAVMLGQHRAATTARRTSTSATMQARSRRSTAASRRCSTGRTSTTRPITRTRRSRG